MSFYFPLPKNITKSKTKYNCEKCKMYKKAKSPYMKTVIGTNYNGIVIVLSSLSKEDDERGRLLINERAVLLRSTCLKLGVNIAKQAAIIPAIRCYSKNPSETAYRCCQNYLKEQLKKLKPKLIICCGSMAFKYIMGIKNKESITKIRNRIIPCYTFNCILFSVYDYLDVRSYYFENAFKMDLQRIIHLWKTKFNKRAIVNKELQKRKILENIKINEVKNEEILKAFNTIKNNSTIAFDYESTNASPYDHNFEITHISFSNKKEAWVFHENLWLNNPMVFAFIKKQMRYILNNESIKKIIQNEKFENLCSRFVFNSKDINNAECTMLATHVCDERRGTTSLDFQNLVRFGIPPYSDTVKKHLKKKNKDDKTNTIREAPHDDLILYAGLDVITTFNNWEVIDNHLLKEYPECRENYRMLYEGHKVFANMTQRGIYINQEALQEFESIIDQEMEKVVNEIASIPEFQEYNQYLNGLIENKNADKKKVLQIGKKKKFIKKIKL